MVSMRGGEGAMETINDSYEELHTCGRRWKEQVQEWGLGIESEDGILPTEKGEVNNRWNDYLRGFVN